MISFYSHFEESLKKELKYIDEAIEDLDYLNIEVKFNIHIGDSDKNREINPLAFRRLQTEKILVKSILNKNVKMADRGYDLYIETVNKIREHIETHGETVTDHDNNILENGEQIYLDELLNDVARYTVCLEVMKKMLT